MKKIKLRYSYKSKKITVNKLKKDQLSHYTGIQSILMKSF